MTDEEKVMLVECDQRSKSNAHQINELKIKLEKLEEKTDDIHTIATSIQLISKDMNYMKQGQEALSIKVDNLSEKLDSQIQEVKTDVHNKVEDVNKRVNELQLEPYEEYKQDKHDLKIAILKQSIGYIISILLGAIGALIAYGNIQF